ncbi:hypothetical protein L7F22_062626 [Adiantum nelumboides]|nr:hypothetical protein [Adiantum nelumboides]
MAAGAAVCSLQPLILISIVCNLCWMLSFASCTKEAVDAADVLDHVSAKCGPHIITSATLKQLQQLAAARPSKNSSTLRVLVPWIQPVGYHQFVDFNPDSCMLDGFSIQVFLQALRHMHPPRLILPDRFQFVLFGFPENTAFTYDDMLDMLISEEVDLVVADLTITRERMEKVAFTVPYMASSLVMVTPFSYGSAGTLWDFLKPFSSTLWITLLSCLVVTGIVLYVLEDQSPRSKEDRERGGQASNHGGSSENASNARSTPDTMPARTSPPSSPSTCTHDPPTNPPSTSAPNHVIPTNPPSNHSSIRTPNHAFHTDPPPYPVSLRASNHAFRTDPPPYPPSNHAVPPILVSQNNSKNHSYDDMSAPRLPGLPTYDRASHSRRIINAYWFASLCIFQAQQSSVRTHLGRIITITWLFVMLIFNSSYTASLASLLSAQKRYPSIEGFQALLRDNVPVGYPDTSFLKAYIKKLNMEGHQLKSFHSVRDYAQALRDPNGVGAVLDELPYVQILLQSECDLTISSDSHDRLPSFGGFGFAFRKGHPMIDQMSKMILAMAEDGTLQVLQSGWNVGDDQRSRCNSNDEPSHLSLARFGGLFAIVASVYLTCIIWHLSYKSLQSLNHALPYFQPNVSSSRQTN